MERPAQLELLRRLGVDLGQGYLFSQPRALAAMFGPDGSPKRLPRDSPP